MVRRAASWPGDHFRFSIRQLFPHSFRVLVVTDLLSQDLPLEDVQYLAGHANRRTTQIYDRRRRRVTQNIVERISVLKVESPRAKVYAAQPYGDMLSNPNP